MKLSESQMPNDQSLKLLLNNIKNAVQNPGVELGGNNFLDS
jgi:hypothetical protein